MQYFNLELDLWDMYTLVDNLNLQGTNFKDIDLTVNGVKTYDEDGNSDDIGILSVDTDGKTQEELEKLEEVLYRAKDNLYETLEDLYDH